MPATQESCFRETLLKGVISFMDHESTNVSVKECRWCLDCVDAVFISSSRSILMRSRGNRARMKPTDLISRLFSSVCSIRSKYSLISQKCRRMMLSLKKRRYSSSSSISSRITSTKEKSSFTPPVASCSEEAGRLS